MSGSVTSGNNDANWETQMRHDSWVEHINSETRFFERNFLSAPQHKAACAKRSTSLGPIPATEGLT